MGTDSRWRISLNIEIPKEIIYYRNGRRRFRYPSDWIASSDKNERRKRVSKVLQRLVSGHAAYGLPYQTPEDIDWSRFLQSDIAYCWFGHSSIMLKIRSNVFLFDPISKVRAPSFLGRHGPRRLVSFPLKEGFKSLPVDNFYANGIDRIHVCLSHDHHDHMCIPDLEDIHEVIKTKIICGLGTALPDSFEVVELAWNERYDIDSSTVVHFLPAQHRSGRKPGELNPSLFGSFMIQSNGKTFFFAGDTGYPDFPLFKLIGQVFGPIDLSFIPIGGGTPETIFRYTHTDPSAALRIHCDLVSKKSVPIHWGTYKHVLKICNETLASPGGALARLQNEDFLPIPIGRVFTLE